MSEYLIEERIAALYSQGFAASELFRKLALDPEIPLFLDPQTVSRISSLSLVALRQRRARRMRPRATAISRRCVRYARFEVFTWLADLAEGGNA
jgi:hypothetical protein